MFAKKIVAGAALLAVAAAAQAGVNVYGTVDMSVMSVLGAHSSDANDENGVYAKRTTHVSSGAMTTSYIGFSGSEDLGGGLKAEFALETFLAADTGGTLANNAAGFWGRASNIALSGSFGKVAIGQYDNPFFTYGLTYNPFGASMTMSPTMRHYYGKGVNLSVLTGDTGWVNSLTYETPNMSGFSGVVQWSPKESSAAHKKDSLTIGGQYSAGPLSLAAAYASVGNSVAYGDVYASKPVDGFASQFSDNETVYSLNGSYDFGVVKAFAQFTDAKYKLITNGNKDGSNKAFQIGVSVPVTAQGAVLASYGESKVKFVGETTSEKNKVFSLAYDHTLSKRTDAYVGLVNERATDLKSGTSFGVGLRHNF
jgi:predicted porin